MSAIEKQILSLCEKYNDTTNAMNSDGDKLSFVRSSRRCVEGEAGFTQYKTPCIWTVSLFLGGRNVFTKSQFYDFMGYSGVGIGDALCEELLANVFAFGIFGMKNHGQQVAEHYETNSTLEQRIENLEKEIVDIKNSLSENNIWDGK